MVGQVEARIARTRDERDAVYRHRYEVYVEELGRYFDRADHATRRLIDPEDATSDHIYVTDGREVVASLRSTWGGNGFSQRQIEFYSLRPFLADVPPETMTVGERTMVSRSSRGRDLYAALAAKSVEATGHDQTLIAFGACEPHLVGFYGHWMRPYADRNINHPESGYLIPLITFPKGLDALLGVGPTSDLPRSVTNAAAGTGAVTCSHLTEPRAYLGLVTAALAGLPASAVHGLATEEVASLVQRSNIIACAAGDCIVRAGGTAHTLYVLLSGATVDGAAAGDAVGSSAALGIAHGRRDVVIASEGAQVLALSEGTLARFAAHHPNAAAAMAASIAKSR
jgi:hypothetical protein